MSKNLVRDSYRIFVYEHLYSIPKIHMADP